jgi:hypothetical protein
MLTAEMLHSVENTSYSSQSSRGVYCDPNADKHRLLAWIACKVCFFLGRRFTDSDSANGSALKSMQACKAVGVFFASLPF